ncbi:MAG: hypothetical protein IJZ96_07265, partial [Lachnospiraceae bacterium]|nr:hypothetical protein [Lachnospiraceae bacterium]
MANKYTGWDNKKDSALTHALDLYKAMNKRQKAIIMILVIAFILVDIKIFGNIADSFGEDKSNKENYKQAVECYEEAVENYDQQLLDDAYQMFSDLSYYEDSYEYILLIEEEKVKLTTYQEAVELCQSENYVEAFVKFETIIDYRDSQEYINNMAEELYADAETMIEEERYDTAKNILLRIPASATEYYELAQETYNSMDDIKSDKNKAKTYENAMNYYELGDYENAQPLLIKVRDKYDVTNELGTIGDYYYGIAQQYHSNGDYDGFFETVDKIDAEREWMEYEKTITYRDQVTEEYKTLVTETANYILLTEGYGAFKQYLNDSVNAGFTQVQADKLLGEKKPVALGSLDPYDAWEFKASDDIMEVSYHKHELSFDYAIRDVNGNLYSEALVGGGYAAAYYIGDSGYTMLTGTVFIQEGCCATVDKPVQLLIRNDEGETLYRCELLSG